MCYSDSPHIKKMMSRKNDFIRTIAYYDEAKLNDDQKKMIPQIKKQNFFEDVVSITELLEKAEMFESKYKKRGNKFICKNLEALALEADAKIVHIKKEDEQAVQILSSYEGFVVASLTDEKQLNRIRSYTDSMGIDCDESDGWLYINKKSA